MRLNNRSKTPLYQFRITLATLILVIGIIFSFFTFIQLPIIGKTGSYGMIFLGLLLYALIYLKGRQIFEYDSDGEALNFKNKAIIPFIGEEAKDEFPKYKLLYFEVVNALLFKKLYIKIKSKKKNYSTLKYDISYLTNQEIRDLKMSLNKVVKQNRENNNEY